MRLAVIPARGGSKRISRKNIRPFLGRPIIEYSIETAQRSGLFDVIAVSTDDEEIAAVAQRAGAQVPFLRPAELADDMTGTNEVVRHAIASYHELGRAVDVACCIYATAPLLTAAMLHEGLDALISSGASFAFSVAAFPFPVQRALQRDENGRVKMLQPQYAMTRSQDLATTWHDAGQFYWGRAEAFLRRESLHEGGAVGVALPRERVQDIDTEEDWRHAELMYRLLNEFH